LLGLEFLGGHQLTASNASHIRHNRLDFLNTVLTKEIGNGVTHDWSPPLSF
jgi:hypothetical protein